MGILELFSLMSVGILFFGNIYGKTRSCVSTTEAAGEVEFCKDDATTGETIFISSGAPIHENENTSCLCDVYANAYNISVSYYISETSEPCGIQVLIDGGFEEFNCTSRKSVLQQGIQNILFSKMSKLLIEKVDVYDNSMCLQLMAETDSANITIRCHKERGLNMSDIETTTGDVNNESSTISTVEERASGTNEVIIAGAAGGGVACVLIVFAIVIIFYCRRRKSNAFQPKKQPYVNTAPDFEVFDNVVYNMEFPDEKKQSTMVTEDTDGIYNTVEHGEEHHDKKTTTPIKNITIPDYENFPGLNTVRCEDSTSGHKRQTNKDLANDIQGSEENTEAVQDFNIPIPEKKSKRDIAYSVVNRTQSANKDRPKQFQIADSADTYALVSK